MPIPVSELRQSWPRPRAPRPIVIIGAGGIVTDAHLPAYRLAGFPVAGVFDLSAERAREVASKWETRAFDTVEAAIATPGAVYDLALPPGAHLDVLPKLPDGAAVLLQKPMGRDLTEATRILQLCRAKRLKAAVNFQLRFSAMFLALADALKLGWLGDIVDAEVHLNLFTPWGLFPFLKGMPRVEIAVHSIHYLDTLRALLGNPVGVHARSLGHPSTDLAQTRTSAIIDFAPGQRVALSINHNHDFGRKFQDASFRVEGDKGAALVKLGLLLDYPDGEPDELWITRRGDDWTAVPLSGKWFPHAFIGTMSNVQRFAAGEDELLATSVEDAWHTMALAEAAFEFGSTARHAGEVSPMSAPTVGVHTTNPKTMPAEHARLPVWNAENWFYEDFEIGHKIRSLRRTISEGESMQFNALVTDMHPYVADDIFATTEGRFGRRLVAGAFVFSAGLGLVATNCVNAFSYGYDKLRFIKPTFIGDTIYTIRTNLEKRPKYRELGLCRASYEVFKGEGELVLYCEHLQTVKYRNPADWAGKTET